MRLGRLIAIMGMALATAVSLEASEQVTLELRDGSRLVGEIVDEDAARVRLRTTGGLEIDVPLSQIAARRRAGEKVERIDPNYSRLMFGPTGRPLRKGDGYFSDYELFFPGFSYGVTNNLTLSGGLSTIPFVSLDEQVIYFAPKLGFEVGPKQAYSVGFFYASAGDDRDRDALGIAFAVGTWGDRKASLSAGIGYAALLEDTDEGTPIVMLGAQKTVSSSIALVAESWIFARDVDLSQQPVGLAIRFFGERLSADVGVILFKEALEEGFPVPWVSVSYHFGSKQRAAKAGALQARPSFLRK
jgi:hypothetical protein